FADAGGAVTVSENTPSTTAATLAAMRRADRMVPSLPAGGRGHWQQSLMDGLDAPVSRLLSLCKSIPWWRRCFPQVPAQAISSASGGRVAPFQLSVCGRRADRGRAAPWRGVGRRACGLDQRGCAGGGSGCVRARVSRLAAASGTGARGDRVRAPRRRVRGLGRRDGALVGSAGSVVGLLQP